MSFQHQHTAAVGLPGVVIFGFASVVFIQHYINLHYAGVFFINRMFYVFTTILAYLKFMNEMRSPVNRPKKKTSSRFILIHKL